jgi:hypothetical protein
MKLKWPLILVACLAVGLGAIVLYLRVFGGHVLQSASSPKGDITAEVVSSGMVAAHRRGLHGRHAKD